MSVHARMCIFHSLLCIVNSLLLSPVPYAGCCYYVVQGASEATVVAGATTDWLGRSVPHWTADNV